MPIGKARCVLTLGSANNCGDEGSRADGQDVANNLWMCVQKKVQKIVEKDKKEVEKGVTDMEKAIQDSNKKVNFVSYGLSIYRP